MRAFIGIKLDDCIFDIVSIINNLKQKDEKANYTLTKNIHITLEFLGEINNSQIKLIENIFSKLDFKAFKITLNKVTNLKNMLILGVQDNNYLNLLQKYLHEELYYNGFTLQNRKYFPHVTIARKSNLKVEESINLTSKITEIILFSSSRINDELTYTPIINKKLKS